MLFVGLENRAPKMMGEHPPMLQKWHASKMKAPIFVSLEAWKNVTLLEKYGVQEEELSVNITCSFVVFCFSIATSDGFCPSTDCVGSTLNPVTTRIIAYLGVGISTYTQEN